VKAEIVLTVSESKRLIAKGLAQTDYIREKLQKGMIVVGHGSTNAYVFEELTGQKIDKRTFLSGRTLPAKDRPNWQVERIPDLVLVDGEPAPHLDRFTALDEMQAGDVYIKGANALNYGTQLAGISIGHPQGGTIGGALGPILGKKLRLVIPVGLEKEVAFDIAEASALLAEPDDRMGAVYSLWPVNGIIFTEIEALSVLCDVQTVPVGAGGIAGAEGAMRLLLLGEAGNIQTALELVDSIQGEPPIV
jgi:hypothetical protein